MAPWNGPNQGPSNAAVTSQARHDVNIFGQAWKQAQPILLPASVTFLGLLVSVIYKFTLQTHFWPHAVVHRTISLLHVHQSQIQRIHFKAAPLASCWQLATPLHTKPPKFKGHSVQEIKWKQTDTLLIALSFRLTRSVEITLQFAQIERSI